MFVLLGGLFVHPLEEAFGWRRGDIALSSGILLGMALLAPLTGMLADRISARMFAAAGGLCLALAYFALAAMRGDIREYFLILAFVALTAGPATSPLIYSRVIVGHFSETRGLALGLCLSGSTALAALMLPMMQWVIATFGWRAGYMALGAVALLLGLCAFVLLSGAKATDNKGDSTPDSKACNQSKEHNKSLGQSESRSEAGVGVGQALRDLRFWLLCLCFAAGGAALFGISAHTQPYLMDVGFSPESAAWTGTLMGIVTIVARLGVGALLDAGAPGSLGLMVFLGATAGALGLAFAPSAWMVIAALCLIACAQSAESDFLSFFTARFFGVRHFGAVSGALSLVFGVCVAMGAAGAGYMYDAEGDYRLFFVAAAALSLVAGVALYVSVRLSGPGAARACANIAM